MSKRRRTGNPVYTTTTAEALTPARSPAKPADVSALHHGNHNHLLTHFASVHNRKASSPTVFGNMEFFGKAPRNSSLHLYIAAASLVAVNIIPEPDMKCWNFAAFSVPDEKTVKPLLDGVNPEKVESCTKRNAMHVRLDSTVDMGLVADIGAAAAFVGTQIDVGGTSLPAMSYVGSAKAQNGQHQVRAKLFAPIESGVTVATAMTHLREDTTSMVAFRADNTDAIAASLGREDMTPGDACHTVPEFIDLSMFRAEQSAEAVIGQLLARSLCQFVADRAA